jgi:hypothetical protein
MKCFSRKYKRTPSQSKHPLFWGAAAAILAVMIWLVAAPSWAGPPKGIHTLEGNEESGQQPPLSKTRVTIRKKSLQHIFTYSSKFAVNKETLIVGTDGKEVKLKKMLVPCDAVVSYQIEKGVPTAKRIDIQRVASDAGWQWVAEHPE